MRIEELMRGCAGTPDGRMRAIFNALFTICNRLQALFDSSIPEVTLRQFMLLSALKQAGRPLTLTQLAGLLGCSRQNARKVVEVLVRKDFARLERAPEDARAQQVELTPRARRLLGGEFDRYRAELSALFEDFAQDDVAELFRLILKLCAGVDSLEARVAQRGGADEGNGDV